MLISFVSLIRHIRLTRIMSFVSFRGRIRFIMLIGFVSFIRHIRQNYKIINIAIRHYLKLCL